ncbi:hypothetical protein QTQ03_28695 [Micromonospora sp. WMMA1363]|uniref:hypothetical protein n=1 Tax=Micromonospora sp. WMMA1363 TaxID=3053985 RepID=UPI00259C8C3F|nr:hypothetical protein [Micromonospora sp. WMMA1363]MDM4723292.1 hypothetical protein [Micromonospora sp. WMMA1363]MDM4723386.1 hypothetical protein [Micromonospora sp. WMMA1363]
MSQSEERTRGRSWPPASFGRASQPERESIEGDFQIKGGEAFHLVLHVQATPTTQSLERLYLLVREATADGVRDGYAQAIAELHADQADDLGEQGGEHTPDGGDAGAVSSG